MIVYDYTKYYMRKLRVALFVIVTHLKELEWDLNSEIDKVV